MAIYDSGTVLNLNLKDKTYSLQQLEPELVVYGTHGPREIKLLRSLPGFDFTMLSMKLADIKYSVQTTIVEMVPEI